MDIIGLFFVAIISLVLALIIANAGSKRKIGYGWSLFLGLFLSPIVSLIAVLLSERIKPDEDGGIEKNWGCWTPLIVTLIIILSVFLLYKFISNYNQRAIYSEQKQSESVITENTEKEKITDKIDKEDKVKFRSESNGYDPLDPRSRPDSHSYYEYTSNEWFDMSKGFEYGANHPKNETTHIRETESRIIIDFSNGKTLLYEILKVKPYEYGVNYVVKIDGKRKTITKSPDPQGGISFSLKKEWIFDKILEASPAGID